MPKEAIYERSGYKPRVEVSWGDINRGYVEVGVDLDNPFIFTADPRYEYTGLYLQLDTPEDVDALIKALRRAKRKTFK